MPGIAHTVVNNALTLGLSTLEWTKSKDGTYLKWAVEKVEGPAKYTLETRLCQTVLKVGDSCLTVADNTIESALNTSTFKNCEALVKTTYCNKLRPAVGFVANTTSCVTTPVGKVYLGTLTIADRQIDYFLPGDDSEKKVATPTIIGLAVKVSRRTGRRVYVAKEWTVTKVTQVSNGVLYTLKQAHPTNVKQNVTALCWMALVNADKLVDRYLPDPSDQSPQPSGPVSLTSKIVRRSAKRAGAAVRAAATAVRRSPAAFKSAARSAFNSVKAARSRAASAAAAIASYDYRGAASALVTYDYRGAAASRALAIVNAADQKLQSYRLTAALRSFVAQRFGGLVRSLLRLRTPAPSVPAPAPAAQLPAPPAPAQPATIKPATPAPEETPTAAPEETPAPVPSADQDASEQPQQEARQPVAPQAASNPRSGRHARSNGARVASE